METITQIKRRRQRKRLALLIKQSRKKEDLLQVKTLKRIAENYKRY